MLRKNGFPAEQVQAIARDFRQAGLEPAEVAIMEFAQKVTLHANQITAGDVDGLRSYGLDDNEILDVILAASARNFISRVFDAVGVEPDAVYLDLDPELRKALTIGRPFGPEG